LSTFELCLLRCIKGPFSLPARCAYNKAVGLKEAWSLGSPPRAHFAGNTQFLVPHKLFWLPLISAWMGVGYRTHGSNNAEWWYKEYTGGCLGALTYLFFIVSLLPRIWAVWEDELWLWFVTISSAHKRRQIQSRNSINKWINVLCYGQLVFSGCSFCTRNVGKSILHWHKRIFL